MRMQQKAVLRFLIFAASLCCLLCGCASIKVSDLADLDTNDVLVFGEIKALNMHKDAGYTLFISQEGSKDERSVFVQGEERVFWRMKPGKYIITGFSSYGAGRIWAGFDVPNDCAAVYFGKMKVALGVISVVDIEDRMDEGIAELNKKFPGNRLRIKKSLVKKEAVKDCASPLESSTAGRFL